MIASLVFKKISKYWLMKLILYKLILIHWVNKAFPAQNNKFKPTIAKTKIFLATRMIFQNSNHSNKVTTLTLLIMQMIFLRSKLSKTVISLKTFKWTKNKIMKLLQTLTILDNLVTIFLNLVTISNSWQVQLNKCKSRVRVKNLKLIWSIKIFNQFTRFKRIIRHGLTTYQFLV